MNFLETREKYKNFIYHYYKVTENSEKIIIEYKFEIENLAEFFPKIEILKKNFSFKNINSNIVKNMIFNIGMIEAISYFKATLSHNFIINCGKLDSYQEKWFKKLYFLGLGEFRYKNNVNLNENDFVNFISKGENIEFSKSNDILSGTVIPVGGGKDSNVTLELLKESKEDNLCFCIGEKEVSLECIKTAGFSEEQIIQVNRIIDKNLISLNEKGFLNGHTPFSAIIAFISYMMSYLLGKKYITLSNENSANETNVKNENINHQYSKTIEFENDFREYSEKYLKANVEYFSFLRPISELQIAMIFSKLEKYHKIFKSCNVGSKKSPWVWCCNCPKCLFVYTILSPFLYKDKLVNIFGEDLFKREDLLNTFIELCGYSETKPFECVGTYSEIRYAITKTIENLNKDDLPYLLKYYKENFELSNENLLKFYNEDNNLPKEFEIILKKELGI